MLDMETVKSILDGVTIGTIERVDVYDPVVAEVDEKIHKQVQETAVQARATHMHVNLHETLCMAAKQEGPIHNTVIKWISTQEVQDLKHPMGGYANTEEGMAILFGSGRSSHFTK